MNSKYREISDILGKPSCVLISTVLQRPLCRSTDRAFINNNRELGSPEKHLLTEFVIYFISRGCVESGIAGG